MILFQEHVENIHRDSCLELSIGPVNRFSMTRCQVVAGTLPSINRNSDIRRRPGCGGGSPFVAYIHDTISQCFPDSICSRHVKQHSVVLRQILSPVPQLVLESSRSLMSHLSKLMELLARERFLSRPFLVQLTVCYAARAVRR